ncbi:hypothetical protein D9611_001388 [Ephemerocybe angulata]|uniref:FAD-binding PCMH-type domain-containing protein n=1 Tax=Ephemerocybe angulata TaxID=980116 RepID=A0A8H5FML6_9AGAR|nr:hypothetical protein D9611_001388 [Tulosesus angulatus]
MPFIYLVGILLAFSYRHAGLVNADPIASLTEKGFNFTYPGDVGFQTASEAFNLRYTYRPAIVAFPTTIDHVSQIVRVGYEEGYNVVARSGGHSYIAAGLGGKNNSIVIDMQNFNALSYDPGTQTAIIGVGNKLGNIITALNANGRALPHGTCAYVGWGGHATYGGYGFTSRLWGLAVDTIISIDVVLANGTIAKASKTQNPDLFWALRGAAGSFGIVTSTQVRTFEAPASATIYSYNWKLNITAATQALQTYQQFSLSPELPAELGIEVVLIPGDSRGTVGFNIAGGWYKPAAQLNATLKPFLDRMPEPSSSSFDIGDYLNSAKNLAGGSLDTTAPNGHDTFYAKSLITPERAPMDEKARRAFITYIANEGFGLDVGWFLQLGLWGGLNSAINVVPREETSFAHRDALFTMQLYAYSEGNVPPFPSSGLAFVDGIADSIVKNSPQGWDYGAYSNYIDDRLANADYLYYKRNLPRLKKLKEQFDPTGVFNSPTGIM